MSPSTPTPSRRRSSVGLNRRQKAHIPYRGDNPEVGKKTGITVRHVERKSDGFEPFEEVMLQADGKTPPRPKPKPKGRKSSLPPVRESYHEEDDEEEGEQQRPRKSVYSNFNGNSWRRPPAFRDSPDELGYERRVDKVAKPLARPPRLPSPQPPPLPHVEDDEMEVDQEEEPEEEGQGMEYDNPPNWQNDAEEEQEEGEEMEEDQHDEEQVQDDVTNHFEDAEMDQVSEEEVEQEPEPEPAPVRKKVKVTEPPPAKNEIRVKLSRDKKENRYPGGREGTRRSNRVSYKPLDWWRGEKVVYGRTTGSVHTGPILVAPIKEIIRIPQEEPMPLAAKRKRSRRARSKSRTVETTSVGELNPEDGWDEDTGSELVCLDYETEKEIRRRVVWTAKMIQPKPAANNEWLFQKVFGDQDYIAAGQIIIPPKGRKPSKMSRDNTYIFFVIEGAVNVGIHESSFILTTGGTFIVPRGNTYFIENIADRDTKLFFAQGRKSAIPDNREGTAAEDDGSRAGSRGASAGATARASREASAHDDEEPPRKRAAIDAPTKKGEGGKKGRATSSKV